jgi:hypothetical protein
MRRRLLPEAGADAADFLGRCRSPSELTAA